MDKLHQSDESFTESEGIVIESERNSEIQRDTDHGIKEELIRRKKSIFAEKDWNIMMRKISQKEEMGAHIIRGLAKMQMQNNLSTSREDKTSKDRAESKVYRESCITMNSHDISYESSNRLKSFAYTENTRNDSVSALENSNTVQGASFVYVPDGVKEEVVAAKATPTRMNTSMGNISLGEIQISPKQKRYDFTSSGREAAKMNLEPIRHSEESLQA